MNCKTGTSTLVTDNDFTLSIKAPASFKVITTYKSNGAYLQDRSEFDTPDFTLSNSFLYQDVDDIDIEYDIEVYSSDDSLLFSRLLTHIPNKKSTSSKDLASGLTYNGTTFSNSLGTSFHGGDYMEVIMNITFNVNGVSFQKSYSFTTNVVFEDSYEQ